MLEEGPYHTSATPVLGHAGRLWKAFEDEHGPKGWGRQSRPFILSIPVDSDLMDSSRWRRSEIIASDQRWANGKFNGFIEGNAVPAPDGSVKIILRCDYEPKRDDVAAMVAVRDDGRSLIFDEEADPARDGYGFLNLPGATKKFVIRRDPKTSDYWSLTSWIHPSNVGGDPERTRNTLALVRSSDLVHWELRTVLLHHPDVARHGYHYADWQFEGDDIVALCRTAWNAKSQHDSNLITFHRFRGFRDLGMPDSFLIR